MLMVHAAVLMENVELQINTVGKDVNLTVRPSLNVEALWNVLMDPAVVPMESVVQLINTVDKVVNLTVGLSLNAEAQ